VKKIPLATTALASLLFLFGFTTAFGNTLLYKDKQSDVIGIKKQIQGRGSFFSTLSLPKSLPAETAVGVVHTAPAPAFKNQFFHTAALTPAAAVSLQERAFLQYHFSGRYIIAGLSSEEIIFPFHYFW
jgi:hypothetical protein